MRALRPFRAISTAVSSRSATAALHTFDPSAIRNEFPAFAAFPDAVFCDGAGGSQIHNSVIEASAQQMIRGSANVGGYYPTSERVLEVVTAGRTAAADLFNCWPEEVTFGNNATTLVFHLSHALRHEIRQGDNIVLSALDHDTNAGPWIRMARECGAEVRWIPVQSPGTLQMDALDTLVDSNTKLVACGYASNALGTINDVARACSAARAVGAYSFVDAVHYAPHGALDVQAIGCDFMVCSPYKFFGPHAGLLFGSATHMQKLAADKIRCSDDNLPSDANCHMSRWELGTQNFEAIAGVEACVRYIGSLGERFSDSEPKSNRDKVVAGWQVVGEHENRMKEAFLTGAKDISSLTVLGISDLDQIDQRTSTFAIIKDGWDPDALTQRLVKEGIYCTSGNHYCTFWEDAFPGTSATNADGAARLGFLHYNTLDEVNFVLQTLESV